MFDGFAAQKERPVLDDEELEHVIRNKLDDDPIFYLSNGRRARFEVEVDDGEATIRGVVRTALDRRKADIIARALGAATVHNNLLVEEQGEGVRKARSRAK